MMTIHEGLLDVIKQLRRMTLDAQKFDEGNAAAGRRCTKILLQQSRRLKDIRKACFEIRHNREE